MEGRNRTTFVLGAGASLHAGYPLAASMLLRWMRSQERTIPFDFALSAELLEQRFGSNIEDLFNGVQAEIERRAPGYSEYANVHKPCIAQAMREWFGEIHAKHTGHAYGQFASKIVRRGDTVVTFDYDVALESSLRHSGKWCVGDGYGFTALGLPAGSPVNVLKLHRASTGVL